MPSLHKIASGKWVVQLNESPRQRLKREFARRANAERLVVRLRDAIDARDVHRAERIMREASRRKGGPTMSELVREFAMAPLRGRVKTEKWRRLVTTRLDDLVAMLGLRSPHDLDALAVQRYIARCVARGDAPKTIAHRVRTAKGFSRWLFVTERLDRDPLALLSTPEGQPQRERRALSVEEVALIIAAASVRPVVAHRKRFPGASTAVLARLERDGQRHGLIYAIAFATAMRAGEIRNLRWRQLHLDAAEIRFGADDVKTRRSEIVYLSPWLVDRLRSWREQAIAEHGGPPDPDARAIRVETHVAERHLRPDARYAGVDLDEHLGILDLHALGRVSLSTWLTEQADLDGHLADLFTRHAAQGSTRTRSYVKRRAERMREIAARIPDLFALAEHGVLPCTLPSTVAPQDGARVPQADEKTASPTGCETKTGEAVETSCPKRETA